jgi:hypothetical protein
MEIRSENNLIVDYTLLQWQKFQRKRRKNGQQNGEAWKKKGKE